MELDQYADEGIEKLVSGNFIPDLIIGITRAGSVFGKILQHKLKEHNPNVAFKVDYRKRRKRYSPNKLNIKGYTKILIVDFVSDSGRTLFESRRDMLDDTYFTSKDDLETWFDEWLDDTPSKDPEALIRAKFPDHDIRLYSVYFNYIDSQIDIQYYNIASIDNIPHDTSWKTASEKNLRDLLGSTFSWKEEIKSLLIEISEKHQQASTVIDLHKTNPLMDVLSNLDPNLKLEKIKIEYSAKISDGGKVIEGETFKNDFKKFLSDTGDSNSNIIDRDIRGKLYHAKFSISKVNDQESLLRVIFPHQIEYRTFSAMCENCTLKDKENKKHATEISSCFICQQYIRTIEFLYWILEKYTPPCLIDCKVYNNDEVLFKVPNETILNSFRLLDNLSH